MAPTEIFFSIQHLSAEIAKARIKYGHSIKNGNSFEDSKKIVLEIQRLQLEKKELENRYSQINSPE